MRALGFAVVRAAPPELTECGVSGLLDVALNERDRPLSDGLVNSRKCPEKPTADGQGYPVCGGIGRDRPKFAASIPCVANSWGRS